MFKSAGAIRKMIAKGALVEGVHWYQRVPRGDIHLDLDACEKLIVGAHKARLGERFLREYREKYVVVRG
jgi:hypothetical protein